MSVPTEPGYWFFVNTKDMLGVACIEEEPGRVAGPTLPRPLHSLVVFLHGNPRMLRPHNPYFHRWLGPVNPEPLPFPTEER